MKILSRLTQSRRRSEQFHEKVTLNDNNYYILQCQGNSFCLRDQLKFYKLEEGDHVRVIGGKLADVDLRDTKGKLGSLDPNFLSFLWMFKQQQGKDYFEIIHARTDLCLSSDSIECELEHGRLSHKQQFRLQQIKKGVYKIRNHKESCLGLDGILQTNDYMERDPTQQFLLIQIPMSQVPAFEGTSFIWTGDPKQTPNASAIDLTNASRLSEDDILLFKINYRMNQRWVFEEVPQEKHQSHVSLKKSNVNHHMKVYIRSALTEQFVSFSREQHKLMQASYPEQWILQPCSELDYFYISHAKLHLYLVHDLNHSQLHLSKQHTSKWFIPGSQKAFKAAARQLQLINRKTL